MSASARAALALGCTLTSAILVCAPAAAIASPRAAVRVGILETGGLSAAGLAAGAERAAAAVNAGGGINGRHLELRRLSAPRPWRDGASLTARLAFDPALIALIGPSTGTAAHVAAQIATRRRLPIITLAAEVSLTQAMDPWVFRGVPDDAAQARALLRWAWPDPRGKRAALVIPDGRNGRQRAAALRQACSELGVVVANLIHIHAHGSPPGSPLDSVLSPATDTLMLWLDPRGVLAFLDRHPEVSSSHQLLGSARLDNREFLTQAPAAATGLAIPLLRAAAAAGLASASPVAERTPSSAPGWAAAADLNAILGYDLLTAVAQAARRGGADPAAIRRVLAGGVYVAGFSGGFHFDRRGNRSGDIPIGVLRGGRFALSRRPAAHLAAPQ